MKNHAEVITYRLNIGYNDIKLPAGSIVVKTFVRDLYYLHLVVLQPCVCLATGPIVQDEQFNVIPAGSPFNVEKWAFIDTAHIWEANGLDSPILYTILRRL